MIAEIAILNKEAIALASDSAVTMIGKPNQKIFTSANKLFSLSKYHPVGIMIYGNATFMDVPWETIIKIYRIKLGKHEGKTLKEYANSFIEFLDNGNSIFPDSIQKHYLRLRIYSYFNLITNDITEKVQLRIEQNENFPQKETKQIVSEIIKDHYESWEKTANIPSIPKSFNKNIIGKYEKIINKAIKDVFQRLPISKSNSIKLKKIVASMCSKFPEGLEFGGFSGVVIAGFGKDDTFPSLESFHIEGIVNNKLKYKEYRTAKIDFEISSQVVPFAQSEMVSTFMEGIDPFLQNQTEGYLSEIFDEYPEVIADNIKAISNDKKKLLKLKLKKVSNKIFKDYQKEVQRCKEDNYIFPITRVVTMLPKDELAAMAEALVNLTSFKRKVTMESETVGGPIDVAVISKGDGIVWIKRKHYFKAELNPQFFANYYKGDK